jgi:molybdopterin converting factor subunit 1
MKIKVKFFASSRDVAGVDEVEVDVPVQITGKELWRVLEERFPGLKRLSASSLLAVNMEYAHSDATLNDGDEVAIIPPVSGG